jgi:membrane protein
MLRSSWTLLRDAAMDFVDDNALSRGAAIAYYTTFSLGPVLVIVIAIAGFVFGEDAARGAIVSQLSGLMGHDAAGMLQTAIHSASHYGSSVIATAVGIATLIITASGVFVEMQSALNAIWKAEPPRSTVGQLVRARLVSLGLVMVLGFLLLVSLVISAALSALGEWVDGKFPGSWLFLRLLSIAVSFVLIAVLFAAIYKVLPDKVIAWRDVAAGAVATTLLFEVGKYVIGLYIGSSSIASSYGAAGALVVTLLWIYYSAQIFLFGAEFTRVYAERHGSHARARATPVNQLG